MWCIYIYVSITSRKDHCQGHVHAKNQLLTHLPCKSKAKRVQHNNIKNYHFHDKTPKKNKKQEESMPGVQFFIKKYMKQ